MPIPSPFILILISCSTLQKGDIWKQSTKQTFCDRGASWIRLNGLFNSGDQKNKSIRKELIPKVNLDCRSRFYVLYWSWDHWMWSDLANRLAQNFWFPTKSWENALTDTVSDSLLSTRTVQISEWLPLAIGGGSVNHTDFNAPRMEWNFVKHSTWCNLGAFLISHGNLLKISTCPVCVLAWLAETMWGPYNCRMSHNMQSSTHGCWVIEPVQCKSSKMYALTRAGEWLNAHRHLHIEHAWML